MQNNSKYTQKMCAPRSGMYFSIFVYTDRLTGGEKVLY